MAAMAAESVDAIVTDPPYELGFMGRGWDNTGIANSVVMWREALRVLKPGGHLLAFNGTRTYHRMTCAIEDAGFEIRDCIAWMYGSGFPKSLDVSKAIDKQAGIWCGRAGDMLGDDSLRSFGQHYERTPKGDPETAAAAAWDGWGTALKPAFEPIVVARKPLTSTVAANVLKHGTGALNIDGCRIAGARGDGNWTGRDVSGSGTFIANQAEDYGERGNMELGRWPANVILDGESAAMLDAQGDERGVHSAGAQKDPGGWDTEAGMFGSIGRGEFGGARIGDRGGASRFFYVAKASRSERNAGLDGFDTDTTDDGRQTSIDNPYLRGETKRANIHPTVKPIDLMRHLVRLVTPSGGLVLDPFVGSGTTGCACALEHFQFVGIDRDDDGTYLPIAEARIAFWTEHGEDGWRIVRERDAAETVRQAHTENGQTDIFQLLTEEEEEPVPAGPTPYNEFPPGY